MNRQMNTYRFTQPIPSNKNGLSPSFPPKAYLVDFSGYISMSLWSGYISTSLYRLKNRQEKDAGCRGNTVKNVPPRLGDQKRFPDGGDISVTICRRHGIGRGQVGDVRWGNRTTHMMVVPQGREKKLLLRSNEFVGRG